MDISELLQRIEPYKTGTTSRSWTKRTISFSNEYIEAKRIDSSNKWLGTPHASKLEKMWSIIIDLKKSFCSLFNYRELSKVLNISLTQVTTGEFKGYWGIRIYGMKQEPTDEIIFDILNYIFDKWPVNDFIYYALLKTQEIKYQMKKSCEEYLWI